MGIEAAKFFEALHTRIRRTNEARNWPWMQPGAISASLDEQGQVARYLATETELLRLNRGSSTPTARPAAD